MEFEYKYLPIWKGFSYNLGFTEEKYAFDYQVETKYAIGLGRAITSEGLQYKITILNGKKQPIPAIQFNFWNLQLQALIDADLTNYILKYTISDNYNNSKSFSATLDEYGVVKSIKDLMHYSKTGTFEDQSIQIKRLNSIIEELRGENNYYLRDQTTKHLEIQQLKINAGKDQATIQELKLQIKNLTSRLNDIKKIVSQKRK